MVGRKAKIVVERTVVLCSTHDTTTRIEGNTIELCNVVTTIGWEPRLAFVVRNTNTTIVTYIKTVVVVPFHFVVVGMDVCW